MADKLKLLIALALLVGGIAGYYLLEELPTIVRVLSVIGGIVLGGIVAGQSVPGRRFFAFARDSRDEAKKVVWPTRKETIQMTGVVIAFVLIMGLFLWAVDSLLGWLVKMAIGTGG